MAIGRRRTGWQQEMFVAASEIRALGNPFYRALNRDVPYIVAPGRRGVPPSRPSAARVGAPAAPPTRAGTYDCGNGDRRHRRQSVGSGIPRLKASTEPVSAASRSAASRPAAPLGRSRTNCRICPVLGLSKIAIG